MDSWVVRYNTFEGSAAITGKTATGSSRWVGNLGDWDCVPGMTYRYNVGAACGTTDRQVSPASSGPSAPAPFGWLNPAANDFHLAASSVAIGSGDSSDYPGTDADGLARDARPDAGALEHH
jgi:hypothetical protein